VKAVCTEDTVWAPCIHGVPGDSRCFECWPVEPEDILPDYDESGEDTDVESSDGH
jgi:hypothetical protein